MVEHADVSAEFCGVEEMIRAAGGYLEVSDDLRPRTLEVARDGSREASTRFWIAVSAMVVVFLAISAGKFRGRLSSKSPFSAVVSANCDQLFAVAGQKAQANGDPSWSLVDAFRELRQAPGQFDRGRVLIRVRYGRTATSRRKVPLPSLR